MAILEVQWVSFIVAGRKINSFSQKGSSQSERSESVNWSLEGTDLDRWKF